jgi:hypothetical protein
MTARVMIRITIFNSQVPMSFVAIICADWSTELATDHNVERQKSAAREPPISAPQTPADDAIRNPAIRAVTISAARNTMTMLVARRYSAFSLFNVRAFVFAVP